MKLSINWLQSLLSKKVTKEELEEKLTMAGLEVETIEPVAAEFSGVVVGLVESRDQHPDADRLSVCKVNVGKDELLQIVCGAANVKAGMKVPVSVVGAVLPGNFKIKKSKLRGVESFGMICSEKELGLADSSEGIMPLPSDAPTGQDVREYLALNDYSIELSITPNRGDCLSALGIARDAAAVFDCEVVFPGGSNSALKDEKNNANSHSKSALNDDKNQSDADKSNVVQAGGVQVASVNETIDEVFNVDVMAPKACPRYVGRVIKNVDLSKPSPLWMQEALRRSGLRSIDAVVDVTNYVLLELGQPMHAFDLDQLNDGITVRFADKSGKEKLVLLNDQEVELHPDTLVIADSQKALAIAGVMGGQGSGVNSSTKDIFLESAFFAPKSIAGQSRKYGVYTDSSHRFERGVDSQLQVAAIERATQLLLAIVGGEPGPVIEKSSEDNIPKAEVIKFRHSRLNKVLGAHVPVEAVQKILESLKFEIIKTEQNHLLEVSSKDIYLAEHGVKHVENAGLNKPKDMPGVTSGSNAASEEVHKNGIVDSVGEAFAESAQETIWHVKAPSYRFDMAIEEDLIEEIIRMRGFDSVEGRLPISDLIMYPKSEAQTSLIRVQEVLADYGYFEAVTYSFVDPKIQKIIDPSKVSINLVNPISQDMSVMRTSLIPGLVGALRYNQNRQQSSVRLFETGLRFVDCGDDSSDCSHGSDCAKRSDNRCLSQEPMIAGIAWGKNTSEQWGDNDSPVDFFDVKGDVENLLKVCGHDISLRINSAAVSVRGNSGGNLSDIDSKQNNSGNTGDELLSNLGVDFVSLDKDFLHPGQSATIKINGNDAGIIGAIHPALYESLDVEGPVFVFELSQDKFLHREVPAFEAISKFPAIRRDLALVVDKNIQSGDVLSIINSKGGALLKTAQLFDVYEGEHIDAGTKSLAFALTLQTNDRTLQDEEVNAVIENVLGALKEEFNAQLR